MIAFSAVGEQLFRRRYANCVIISKWSQSETPQIQVKLMVRRVIEMLPEAAALRDGLSIEANREFASNGLKQLGLWRHLGELGR